MSLEFVLKGPVDTKISFSEVMAWQQTEDKPVP